MDEDTQKTLFLKGTKEECMEILNLICGGYISQGTFRDVKELCRRYSKGLAKGKTIGELVKEHQGMHLEEFLGEN